VAIGDPAYQSLLLRGFYESQDGWRWTAKKFALSVAPPRGTGHIYLSLDFGLPAQLASQSPTLTARVNGVKVGEHTYTSGGRYQPSFEVPEQAFGKQPAEVEFELDKSVMDTERQREHGINAVGVSMYRMDQSGFDREAEITRARNGYQYLLKKRALLIQPDKQQELMKLFHDVPVWKHMFFHNVPIEKNPLDLWMMQQIIYEVQPELIVETGTWRGGSALYWAHTLRDTGLANSRVVTVDIQDIHEGASANPLWKQYVTFYKGSSTDADIVAKIAALAKGKKVLVALDSDHSMTHVLAELKAYSPFVGHGSYLVVEDTHMDGVPTAPDFGPGPLAAVNKFLEDGGRTDFEQDLTREAYIMTFNPGGWLKRK